ncbi:MAG: restriction endonuclease subunit S [Planctomycetia bacterium]|nr:restriction endonuclease subunit S [Planctomycetia bacterium]
MVNKTNKPQIRFKAFINADAWEQRKLGKVADFSKGQGYTKSDLRESGTPIILYGRLYTKYQPIIREVDTFAEILPGAVFSKGGEVILPSSGETAEDIAIASSVEKSGFLLGSGLNVVFPHKELQSAFLAIELSFGTPHDALAKRAQGKSVVHLYNEDLKEVLIAYPSIDEQAKISSFFDNLDYLITLHQRKYAKLTNVKKSMLEKMFPKDGASVPEIRFAGFTDAWEQRKVGELTNILSASRVHKEEWATDGVPFFRSSDVVSAYKGTSNEKAFISFELYEELAKSSGKLEKGDILITGGGSIGIPYIVPNNEPLYSKDADLIWIKNTRNFDSQYLFTYLTSSNFRTYLSSISHIGTIAHYTIEQVKETPISLPTIEEQKLIGDFFRNLDHLITLHQRELVRLQNIKKSCLEKMFV